MRPRTAEKDCLWTSIPSCFLVGPLERFLSYKGSSLFQVISVPRTKTVQSHVMDRQCTFRARFGDVGVGDASAVHYIDRAGAVDAKAFALQYDGRVFVDSYSQDSRVLGNRAQQAADAAAFGEVLVDNDVPDQAKPWSHVEIADAVRFLACAPYKHGLAHDRCACRCACHDPATQVYAADHLLDRRVPDLARYAQLIAASEEDPGSVIQYVGGLRFQRLAPFMYVEFERLVRPSAPNAFS